MVLPGFYRTLARLASVGGKNGKVQIFIFHRVLDHPDPLLPNEPDIKRFEALMNIVSKVFNVIPLTQAVEGIQSSELPPRAACITFDDGYIDNYTNALPILKKYGLPATIFIATDYLDGGMMWNDVIFEAIRRFGGPFTLKSLGVNGENCSNDEEKLMLLQNIIPKIKYMEPGKRAETVGKIEETTGYQRQPMMMGVDQIQELLDNGVTIGAHTKSHPILRNLTDQEAQNEIAESREILQKLIGSEVSLFAYPNGRPGEDYSDRDVEIVKKLGFRAAVSTRKAIATSRDNLFELPRFTPWDNNINKFMLRGMLENFRA
jgi:peptidoglycan/xylan/chitin deacetylase (PgdA/CDA1 family)